MKYCKRCDQILPLDGFYRLKTGKPSVYCKVCSRKQALESQHRKIVARRAAESPRLCRHCGDPIMVPIRSGPRRLFCEICSADHKMRKHFGIGSKQRDAMLAQQGGVCALCGTNEPGGRGWHIDHDRACCPTIQTCGNCVRAILCHACNTGLGLFNDDPDSLIRAAEYLKSFS